MGTEDEVERFLKTALDEGFLSSERVEECRRIVHVVRDLDTSLTVDEIAVRKGFLTRKQADAVQRAAAAGRIGPYQVIDRIGRGGVGVVFRARDTRDGTVVALKVLADAVRRAEGGEEAYQRFLRESRVATTLRHENVVRGLASGEDAGYTWLAMEFVPGETLEARLRRVGKLPEREAFHIALEVVRGLEHLQEFQLVHRDVKPANVMIPPEGAVKICDLGLTRPALHEAKELGVVEVPLGTAVYVSPEQIRRPDSIDWRADVYSLGATLYHAISGTPPFTADTPDAVARKHLGTPPRDPREFALELSEGAVNVVLKMLQKEPRDRYASLAALREDLESVAAGKVPVHTLSAAPIQARGKRRPAAGAAVRRKRSVAPLVAAGLGLVVLVAAFLWWSGREPEPRPRGETARTPAPGDAGTAEEPPAAGGGEEAPPEHDPEELEAARTALANALGYWRDHPEEWKEVQRRLDFVAQRYGALPPGSSARDKLADLEQRRAEAASRDFERRRGAASQAETLGRLLDAWSAYRDFPIEYDGTPAAAALREQQARLVEAARAAADAALAAAREAEAAGRFADARKALDAAAPAALPGVDRELAEARSRIDAAEELAAGRRAAERELLAETAAEALLHAGRGDHADALAIVVKRRPELTLEAAEVEELERDLDAVRRIAAAARAGFEGRKGSDAELAVPGRPASRVAGRAAGLEGELLVLDRGREGRLALDVAEVGAGSVLDLAGLDVASAEDARAGVAYALARADEREARARMELLGLAAGPQAAARAEWLLEAVRVAVGQRLEDDLRLAELARRAGRLDEARERLAEPMRLAPEDPAVLLALGRVLAESGAHDDAIAVLRRAAAAHEPLPESRFRLARALAERGDEQGAQQEYRAFLAAAPRVDPLRREAEKELAAITEKLARTAAEGLRKDAARHFQLKRWPEAEEAYARLLALLPSDPEAQLRLGLSAARQDKAFLGYRWLTVFVRGNPQDRRVGEAQKELASLERFRPVRAEDRDLTRTARAAEDEGRLDEAIELYRKSLVWSPFHTTARLGLGRALLARARRDDRRDDYASAAETAEELLVLEPESLDALALRAQCLVPLGEPERALADAEKVLAADATDDRLALLAGRAALRLERLEEAARWFEEAFRRRPSAAAVLGRALVLERRGRLEDALEALGEVLDAHAPDEAERREVSDAMRRVKSRLER